MKLPSRRTQKLKVVSAPIGGLNARDGLDNMPPADAVVLINWYPDAYGIRCRKGCAEWAIGFPANSVIKSIVPYFSSGDVFPSGTFLTFPTTMPGELFATTDTAIYDVTSSTNTPTSVFTLSGNTNAGWLSSCMLSNAAGDHMLVCSEADGYITYDGTTWVQRVAGAGAGQINGVNPTTFVHVSMWKRRAWFVERNSTRVWYLPADAIAGTVTELNLGPIMKKGGHVEFSANWTIDAGEGIDDFLVFATSNGEVIVYKGTDPASAATFALVGVWFIGQVPVGRRGYCQYGGDLLIASTSGVTPISVITRGGTQLLQTSSKNYSGKLGPLIGTAMKASFTSHGWQLMLHPTERLMICNVPNYSGIVNQQFVLSTSVEEWCLFNDIPALCMGEIGGYAFTGTRDGRVMILFASAVDQIPYDRVGGEPIYGEIVPAFNYMDAPTVTKMFLMAKPSFTGVEPPSLLTDVVTDFSRPSSPGTATFVVPPAYYWGSGTWGTALWSGGLRSFAEWLTVTGEGVAGALSISTACLGDTTMSAITYMYEEGGPF